MTTAFTIDKMGTELRVDPKTLRQEFERNAFLRFESPFSPAVLDMLLLRAEQSHFAHDHVVNIGDREIESRQSVGGTVSLMLGREPFRKWLEQATGLKPIRAVAGRLAQTRVDAGQALGWHDDLQDRSRLLAVVINLSNQVFSGGEFQLRHTNTSEPFLSHYYTQPGEMMVFAVRDGLEHRVTEVTSGGPRRVYAGWFLLHPEGESPP